MHKHAEATYRTVGWSHCVAPSDCSGAPHGGVTHIATCACGAERSTESNGNHVTVGAWYMPDGDV